jgi:hypothetical protein
VPSAKSEKGRPPIARRQCCAIAGLLISSTRLAPLFTRYCLLYSVMMTSKIGNRLVQQIFLKIG